MTKQKTNETQIKTLIKNLNLMELAILRERLLTMGDLTRQSLKEEPNAWDKGFIAPSYYQSVCDKIDKHLGFND
mgnify:CR=1 FL=1|jgi:hypothetical protein